jgi:outer membrane lipoprotein-sorting protein
MNYYNKHKKLDMKKNVLLVVFALFLANVSFAQNKAKALLDEVSEKINSYENIQLSFKYNLKNTAENVNQEMRGKATLQGSKYFVELMGVTQLFDGEKLYTINPEDEEVIISKKDEEDEGSFTVAKFYSFYQDGYTYKMDIVQNIGGRKIQYVKLIPIDTNAENDYILIGVDTKAKNIYKVILATKNGTKITITINSFKTNQPIAKKLFVFDPSKYADYDINELD